MIIDAHVHVGKSLYGHQLEPEQLMENMSKLNIDKALLIPMKPPDYHFEPENSFIAGLIKANPARFVGFGRVDPWQGQKAVDEIKRIFEELKLAGIFIHPWEENFPLTSRILRPIVEEAGRYGKPVMVSGGHVRVSHPRQVEYLAREYPEITFIATSGGQINICGELMYDAEEMLVNCHNIIMETSGIYRRDFIEQMTNKLGFERIIFGSGAPYYQQDYEIERIKTAELSDAQKSSVLGGSVKKILGIE